MAHDLAAFGNAAEQGEDEAAHRVDLAPLVLGQHAADFLLEELDGRAAVDIDRAVDPARDRRRLGDVVLVLDLAHDLLDQILDGQKPVGAAEPVTPATSGVAKSPAVPPNSSTTSAMWVRERRMSSSMSSTGRVGATKTTRRRTPGGLHCFARA